MRLHVVLPNQDPDQADQLVDTARAAEELGYAGVYLSDHLLPPQPYGAGPYDGVYEPLVTLSYIAASTSRIRLGTSILVLPVRDPFLVAKQAATMDRLSGGRVTLGVGLGWSQPEFANLGADFSGRAARADEALRLLRQLWETGEGPFQGEYFAFAEGYFAPRPSAGLKILIGGTAPAALRRAARDGDIWQSPPIAPEQFAPMAREVRDHAVRPIEVGGRLEWSDPETPLEEVVHQIDAWADAGADQLAISFGPPTGFGERMAALAHARLLNRAAA